MVGWYYQLIGHESEQTPGDSEGQGSLACYSPWGGKELDTTQLLNNSLSKYSNPELILPHTHISIQQHFETCWGFSGGASGKEFTYQYRRYKRRRFDPWIGEIPWRRKWLSTTVFLPGKSHGQRSLAGYSPWGCTELDTTEHPHTYTRPAESQEWISFFKKKN